jgi:cytochrome c oxidase subunit 2
MNELLRRALFLPRQGSSVALGLDQLHFAVIIATLGGATLVAAVAAYFMVRYRRGASQPAVAFDVRPGRAAGGVTWHFEALAAGVLLLLFVLFWVVGFAQFVQLETPPPNAVEIHVIGKQWMWTFGYPNGRGSKAVLYVPANRPVKLSMTSRDVIHSFFVPEFRVKKDVVPGRITELWFEALAPGRYAGYCTEYCGEGHSTMRATVVALEADDYVRELERLPELDVEGPVYREPAVAGTVPAEGLSLAEMGERVATNKGCMRCHTPDGTPHIGPTWVGMFGATVPLEGGDTIVADAAYLTESMMDPLLRVHRGYPPVMPSYRGLLSAAETGALLEYLRAVGRGSLTAARSPLPPSGSPSVRLPTAPGSDGAPEERP